MELHPRCPNPPSPELLPGGKPLNNLHYHGRGHGQVWLLLEHIDDARLIARIAEGVQISIFCKTMYMTLRSLA